MNNIVECLSSNIVNLSNFICTGITFDYGKHIVHECYAVNLMHLGLFCASVRLKWHRKVKQICLEQTEFEFLVHYKRKSLNFMKISPLL